MTDCRQLDIRRIPPPQKHPLIFKTFDELEKGEAFELINDHEPRPLLYQFQAERPGQFGWRYEEEGPEVWRVNIAKV
ncbi:MAG TPA: hemerythrin [Bacteroidetes bacterium]|nr:hemerythrin [Bacteroidota bacterium]